MTGNPDQQPAEKSAARICLGMLSTICLSRFLHACAHIGWRLVKLSAVIVFLLWAVGVPGNWLAGKLEPHIIPYRMEANRITWNPLQGLIIHDVRCYESNLTARALFSVENCIIRPSYRQLIRGRWRTRYIDLHGGGTIFPSKHLNAGGQKNVVALTNIEGRIQFDDDKTLVHATAASVQGTEFTIAATILKLATSDTPLDSSRWTQPLHNLHLFLFDAPSWLTFAKERIQAATFDAPPKSTIDLYINPNRPSQNYGSLEYRAPSFLCYGQSFDGLVIEAGITGAVLRIDRANIQQGETRINIAGQFNAGGNVCEVHVYNDMPPQAIIPFLSESWRDKIDKAGLVMTGSMQAEGWIGPCRLEDVPVNWGGWTTFHNAELNSFPIERAFVSFKRSENTLALEDGLITGGTGKGKGSLNFSLITDYQKRLCEGLIDLGFDLKQVNSILPRGVRIAANLFDIDERPVRFNGSISIPLDRVIDTSVSGSITGTNGYFRGAPLTGINSYLYYSNLVVKLDPFNVTCATGVITGSLDLDLRNKQYGVNLEVTTNPKSVAPMIGTNALKYFNPYHFSDDILVKVNGLIDARDDSHTDLSVSLSGRNIGITNIATFDRVSALAHRGTGKLAISNILAHTCQGTITGSLDIVHRKTGNLFDARLSFNDLSFDEAVAMLGKQPTNRYEGRISGETFLKGKFPDAPAWKNLSGTGSFVISDGRLMHIPLFGGLSDLLSKLLPGLGFSEQNHLKASITFKDGAMYTDDLRLSGNMITITGRGSYNWMDDLDLYVQVRPFRDGSLASLVRVVTMPISYMLEFKATGPRKNPSWRPAKLPL